MWVDRPKGLVYSAGTMKLSVDMWVAPRPMQAQTSRPLSIVALGGDGIGPEVVAAAVRCLEATGVALEIDRPAHGASTLASEGTPFPERVKTALDEADAILFGAVEKASRDILRYIRFHLDTYANLRPASSLPGVRAKTGDGKTNMVIVRELTEGMYPAREGDLSELAVRWPDFRDRLGRPLPPAGKFAVSTTTEPASRRIVTYAIELAKHRRAIGGSRGHVTIVHKSNVLSETDGMFLRICREEIEAAGLTHDDLYVDEAARRMVACPERFDVVVTTNLFGDILSDVASEVMGGMPLAPSAGIGDRFMYFEPCHGSAPDIAGLGVANPTAAMMSAAMLLSVFGHSEAAQVILDGILATLGDGTRTKDLGGSASCEQFTDAVVRRISASSAN